MPQRADLTSDSSAPDHNATFANHLRYLLAARNMTNKELAGVIHTGESTVSRWVNGKQRPSRRRIALLEQLLSVEPGTLQECAASFIGEANARRGLAAATLLPTGADNAQSHDASRESPDRVMLEFNRWLEPYIQAGGYLRAVEAAGWMQRMWHASSGNETAAVSDYPAASPDPDVPLDIDVEAGTGIAITTGKGRLVVVNNALCEMLGLTADQIVGRYVWELNVPDYREAARKRIEERRTEPWDLELMSGSGDRIPVTISNVLCHLRGTRVRVALVKRRDGEQAGQPS